MSALDVFNCDKIENIDKENETEDYEDGVTGLKEWFFSKVS